MNKPGSANTALEDAHSAAERLTAWLRINGSDWKPQHGFRFSLIPSIAVAWVLLWLVSIQPWPILWLLIGAFMLASTFEQYRLMRAGFAPIVPGEAIIDYSRDNGPLDTDIRPWRRFDPRQLVYVARKRLVAIRAHRYYRLSGPIADIVSEMARKIGSPIALYLQQDKYGPSAYAERSLWGKRYISVNNDMLNYYAKGLVTDNMLGGVLAHELGHIVHDGHIRIYLNKIASFILVLWPVAVLCLVPGFNSLLLALVYGPTTLLLRDHNRRLARRSEMLADAYAVNLGNGAGLRAWLERSERVEQITRALHEIDFETFERIRKARAPLSRSGYNSHTLIDSLEQWPDAEFETAIEKLPPAPDDSGSDHPPHAERIAAIQTLLTQI